MIELNYEPIYKLIGNGTTIATMESCTGGALASAITDCSGASEIFFGGDVTYSNLTKAAAGVDPEIISQFGVYSLETAEDMARTAATKYGTVLGVGITGSLGRLDPNNADSVSGKVYCAICSAHTHQCSAFQLTVPQTIADRHDMKTYVINEVLQRILAYC